MTTCVTCKRTYSEGERFCPFDATELLEEEEESRETVVEDTLAGTVLDERFKLIRLIGSGGMGKVYEAEHVRIMRRVAIKILRDSEAENPEMVQRFRQEAMSASKIGHPGIVEILDFGTAPNGALYMVMELLKGGGDLSEVLASSGPLSAERLVTLLGSACEALEAAHKVGIIHRDLKPENLFLTQDENGRERVKVLDFGLAKMSDLERPRGDGQRLTKTGMIFGTPKYMSPEQARGRSADARSDVYAMGIIAYELLTGKPPFDGGTFLGVLAAHLGDAPPSIRLKRLDIPDTLEAVVLAALEKEPDNRPQSMAALANQMYAALGLPAPMQVTALPKPSTLSSPPPRPSKQPSDPALAMMATVPDVPSDSQRLKLSMSDIADAPKPPRKTESRGVQIVVALVVLAATVVAFALMR
jgi:serine/threonine protein kinase